MNEGLPVSVSAHPAVDVWKKGARMQKGIDRRTVRTRRALHEALMRLVLEKGYDVLTVQDIIDEADVGRSTFYAHFQGKDQLLRGGFEAFRRELAHALPSGTEHPPDADDALAEAGLALFAHAGQSRHIHKAMLDGRGGAIVERAFRQLVTETFRACLAPKPESGTFPNGLQLEFVVATFLTVLEWSFSRKCQPPADDLNVYFLRLAKHGLHAG